MKLTIEQHELRAVTKNIDEMLPFIDAQQCEQAIQALIPILEGAINAKDALENQDHAFEEKKGKDLLAAILERRSRPKDATTPKKKGEKVEKKRSREQVKDSEALRVHWNEADLDEGMPVWAPYKFEEAPIIVKVESFGKQYEQEGLFLRARAKWGNQTFCFFATAQNLNHIDDLESRRYRDATSILKRDISKFKMTPNLKAFLSKTKWGKALLDSI